MAFAILKKGFGRKNDKELDSAEDGSTIPPATPTSDAGASNGIYEETVDMQSPQSATTSPTTDLQTVEII